MNDLRFVQLASGLRMGYVEAGPRDGVPIILLHGFPEFHYSWRFQLPALAQAGFRAVAPDQRCYNRTDKTPPYGLGTLTQDIADLQDSLGITRSHIVGHDWGGAVMWSFAARFPERVIEVIGMNAPHPNAYMDVVRRSWKQFLRSQYITFYQLPRVPEWLFMGWYRAAMRNALRSGFKTPEMKINHPTLLIWGEQDAFITKDVAKATGRYVPNLQIEYLPDATHWVQMDEPEKVNAWAIVFLRQG